MAVRPENTLCCDKEDTMPSNLPLATVVVEIIKHTPAYVWLILLALVALGALQMRDHTMTRGRLVLAPVGLGAFSLWGATSAFGADADIVAAWAIGVALGIAAARGLRWPRQVRLDAQGRFALQGSPWPLVAMLSIFALRYAVAVSLVLYPELASVLLFDLGMALAYGALSGLFAGRALRILRASGGQAPAYAAG